MKKLSAACIIAGIAVAAAVAQGPGAATPGPEQKNLAKFVGTWKMDGKMSPGPMGPGGAFTATETCRLFEGGFHVVCDSEGSGAMGNMKGHMLMTYDRAAKKYRYFAVNNMPDADMAEGALAGNTWTFKGEMNDGGKKMWSLFTITETTPTLHTFTWKMSDDGKKWMTVLEGTSTKQ